MNRSRFLLIAALLAITACALAQYAGLQVGAPWPKYQANSFNSGLGAGSGSNGVRRWVNETAAGNQMIAAPAIATDGTIYATPAFELLAINPDGSAKWTFDLNSSQANTPAIASDGTIYVAGVQGTLYAVSPTGTKKWDTDTADYISERCAPAIGPDGTIYIGDQYGGLYAVNPADGSKKWTSTTYGPISTSPAVGSDGTVYVTSGGYLQAFNGETGASTWIYSSSGDLLTSPLIGPDGTIYFGSSDNNCYAVSSTGTLKWKQPIASGTYTFLGDLAISPGSSGNKI